MALVWEINLIYGNAFSHLALALVNDSVLLVRNPYCLDMEVSNSFTYCVSMEYFYYTRIFWLHYNSENLSSLWVPFRAMKFRRE